jgi:hypothetical protein
MAIRVIGFLVIALSALILAIVLRGIWNGQRTLQAHGINKPIPLDGKSRLILLGWFLGLIVGVVLVIAS